MKIQTINGVKYQGKFIAPGTELDVKKEIADELIAQEAAVIVAVPTKQGDSNEPDKKG